MRFAVAGAGSPAPRTAVAGRSPVDRQVRRGGRARGGGRHRVMRHFGPAVEANRTEGISGLESGPRRIGERSYRESWRRRSAAAQTFGTERDGAMKFCVTTCVVFVVSAVFLAAPAAGQECVRTDTAQGFRLDCTWSGQECVRTDTAQGFRLDCRTRGATMVEQPRPVAPPPQPAPQVVASPPPQPVQPAAEMGIVLAGGVASIVQAYQGQSLSSSRFGYVEGRITAFDFAVVPYGGATFSLQGGGRPFVTAGLEYPLGSADSIFRIAPRLGILSSGSSVTFVGGASIDIGRKVGVQATLDAGAREGVSTFLFHYGAYFRF